MSESKEEIKKRRRNKIKRNEGVARKAIVSCLMKACMYNIFGRH